MHFYIVMEQDWSEIWVVFAILAVYVRLDSRFRSNSFGDHKMEQTAQRAILVINNDVQQAHKLYKPNQENDVQFDDDPDVAHNCCGDASS